MNTMEKFCLKWNDFETNIRESFKELREDHNYYDVTLATDDGHTIEAHKIILSSGSRFFNKILKHTKHQSHFIYLQVLTELSFNILWIFCTMVWLIFLRKH